MKYNRGLLISVVLGMTALACVVPSLLPASPVPPTPDTRLERMVAETVSAALQLTQQAVPTITPVPTSTSTPIPTATITPIPASPTLTVQNILDENTDGTNTYIDLSGKYQITIPTEWLALRIDGPEYLEAGLLPEAENPAIQRNLNTIQNQDPNVFRLFLLDIDEKQIDNGFVTNINLVWDQQMEVSLTSDIDIKGIAATLPASLKGVEITATELELTETGIPYGVITARTPALSQEGEQIIVIQKLVYLDLPLGTLSITLSTTEKWQKTVEPSFDKIIESFIVLE